MKRAFSDNRLITCLALAAVVISSRLWLINIWGSPAPFWDQWDAEAIGLYMPWLDGTMDWKSLFAGHNEHRIVFTRLTSLLMFIAQGKWSVWTELVFNAILHATLAAGLLAAFWRSFQPLARAGLAVGLSLVFCAPSGWENALWGFQSQFYLASLLGLIALAGLNLADFNSPRWRCGVAASIAALGTHGGGIFVPAAGIIALMLGQGPNRPDRQTWITAALLIAVCALGAVLRVEVPLHAGLHARNITEFLNMLIKCLAWPCKGPAVIAIVMQTPVCVLISCRGWKGRALSGDERLLVALAMLSWLSAAAVAHSRGHAQPWGPSSRHQDVMIPGLIAQLVAALRLGVTYGRPGRLALVGWCACTLMGLISLTEQNFTRDLPVKRFQDQASLEMLRLYEQVRDPRALMPKPYIYGPHPVPDNVIKVLEHPLLRPKLPSEMFDPLGTPVVKPGLFALGRWLTLGSALLLMLSVASPLARRRVPAPS